MTFLLTRLRGKLIKTWGYLIARAFISALRGHSHPINKAADFICSNVRRSLEVCFAFFTHHSFLSASNFWPEKIMIEVSMCRAIFKCFCLWHHVCSRHCSAEVKSVYNMLQQGTTAVTINGYALLDQLKTFFAMPILNLSMLLF